MPSQQTMFTIYLGRKWANFSSIYNRIMLIFGIPFLSTLSHSFARRALEAILDWMRLPMRTVRAVSTNVKWNVRKFCHTQFNYTRIDI